MALRSDPGLDLATHVMDGSGSVVGAEQLRFSRAELSDFFAVELSGRELAATCEETAGWPAALVNSRTARAGAAGDSERSAERFASNFVAVRLLGSLAPEVRTDLLDLAVIDPLDPEVVDEVLGSSDARVRVAKQPELDGLLSPVDEKSLVRRLHPLVRAHCLDLLCMEDPVRKRSVHARMAPALARRGN